MKLDYPAQERKEQVLNIFQCFLTLSSKRLAMVSPGHVCQHRMKVNWPTVDKKCCWQKQQEQRRRKQLNSCCVWPLDLDNKVEYVDQIKYVFKRIQYWLIQDFPVELSCWNQSAPGQSVGKWGGFKLRWNCFINVLRNWDFQVVYKFIWTDKKSLPVVSCWAFWSSVWKKR